MYKNILQDFIYIVKKEVKIAMLEIDQQFDLNDHELAMIKELCDALAPLEIAVQCFCQEMLTLS